MNSNNLYDLAENYLKVSSKNYTLSAAGMLFLCLEDKTIFLSKRSKHQNKSLTWGTVGGKLENKESPKEAAEREVLEELTIIPSDKKLIKSNIFKNGNFTYTTFIYAIPLSEKQSWTPLIKLDSSENIDAKWFDINNLPDRLHPGMYQLLPIIRKIFKDY